MDARELNSHVMYTGMERDARAIILKDNLATAEDVALMTAQMYLTDFLKSMRLLCAKNKTFYLLTRRKWKNLTRWQFILVGRKAVLNENN